VAMKVNVPKRVVDRFLKEVGRFQKILRSAKDRDVSEADTVTIITDILSDVFGFDKYTEITSEQAIRGTYCDLAVKVNDTIKYLIEVKAIGLNLKENHLRQAVNYGVNHGIPWVVLTNGIIWEIYKIRFERPIEFDLVYRFDFETLNPRKTEDQQLLYLLCKGGIAKAAIEDYHEHVQSVNRFVISAIILSDPVMSFIRKEFKKVSASAKPSNQEIENILVNEIFKRDVIEGDAASKAKFKVKRALSKSPQRKAPAKSNQIQESGDINNA
jgi:predicted type IV restriction endonuclease